MIGFAIGLACLWGLTRVLRGSRRWGGGCGGSHSGGWHRHRGHRRGCADDSGCGGGRSARGPQRWLWWMFERLDTTPEQEKDIRGAVDDFMDTVHEVGGEVSGTKGDVGRAFREEDFNAEVLGEVFSRHDDSITKARAAMVELMGRVHGVLDQDQRNKLGRWLERRGPWRGPYR